MASAHRAFKCQTASRADRRCCCNHSVRPSLIDGNQIRCRLLNQPLDQPLKLRRRRLTGNHLAIADTGPSKSLLFDCIARSRCSLMVTSALILDYVARPTIFVDEEKIHPFRVNALVRLYIATAQNFAQRHLRHYLPMGIAPDDNAVQFPEKARLAPVQQWLDGEVGSHHNA